MEVSLKSICAFTTFFTVELQNPANAACQNDQRKAWFMSSRISYLFFGGCVKADKTTLFIKRWKLAL